MMGRRESPGRGRPARCAPAAVLVLLGVIALALWSAHPAAASPLLVVERDLLRVVEDPLLPAPLEARAPGAGQRGLLDGLEELLPFLEPGPPPPPPGKPPPGKPPPSPDREPPGPRRGKQDLGRGSLGTVLGRARRRDVLSARDHREMRAILRHARRSRARLGGQRRRELSGVIAAAERLARRGRLTTGRLEVVLLQIERNARYWRRHGAPRAGTRVSFPGSPIVFQYFPGQGMQFHPLANFGRANALYNACATGQGGRCQRKMLRRYLDRLARLGSTRAGFLTWEYFFSFGGGAPPWTSGMAQGTALQAFARSARLLDEPRYRRYARQMLGAFSRRPTQGVRVDSSGGRHYLLYSFDRRLRVLNGHLQATIGLFDHARATASRRSRALYRAGSRSALRELHRYDLGNWSRYAQGGGRASVGYHELVTLFLERLCQRTGHRIYCRYARRFRGYL